MKLLKHQDLIWLEEMEKRGGLTQEMKRELNQKQSGFTGESDFGRLIYEYMPKHWSLIQDLRLKTIGGEIQIDALLVNNLGLTVFEVKNYTADYRYVTGRWQVNGRPKYHDDFQQLDRTVGLLSQLLKQNNFEVPLKKFVVYINEQDTVEIDDSTLPFIKRAKLRSFIKETINDCQAASNHSYSKERDWLIKQHLEDYRRLSLTDEEFVGVKKGIYCVNCTSFKLSTTRYHFHCQHCHYAEAKEKAIVRTTCDYGLLFPYRNLIVPEVMDFIGPCLQKEHLYIILSKYFTKKPSSTHFINPQLPLSYRKSQRKFHYKDKPAEVKLE